MSPSLTHKSLGKAFVLSIASARGAISLLANSATTDRSYPTAHRPSQRTMVPSRSARRAHLSLVLCQAGQIHAVSRVGATEGGDGCAPPGRRRDSATKERSQHLRQASWARQVDSDGSAQGDNPRFRASNWARQSEKILRTDRSDDDDTVTR